MSELPQVCKAYMAKAGRVNEDDDKPLAAATLRNRIRYLTSACRYTWKHHGMCEHDPSERVIAPMVRNERRRYIKRKEMLQLCRACKHRPTRAAIRIAFYSGMRMDEIRRAERIADTFVLADTKNGEPRIVPMHRKIRCCSNVVLPDQSRISKHFRDTRKRVGLGRRKDVEIAASCETAFAVERWLMGFHPSCTATPTNPGRIPKLSRASFPRLRWAPYQVSVAVEALCNHCCARPTCMLVSSKWTTGAV